MDDLRAKSLTELLTTLRQLDVEVWSEQDRVRCRARKGVLTPLLQSEITRWKPELLAFLKRTHGALRRVDVPLRRIPRGTPLPASFGQQRLWFLQELDPDSYAYNIPGAVRIVGPLDISALEKTLEAIVQRHEALRTSFQLVDGSLIQFVGPGSAVRLEPLGLSGLSPADQQLRVRELISSEAKRPFSISSGPHLRVSLLRLNEEEHALIIIQHHIISDGWSLGIFVREMGELYDAFVSGRPSPLNPLAIQYSDYAYWQRQWLAGEALQDQLAFWKQLLKGPLPVLNLPTDRPRPRLQTFNGSLFGTLLPAPLSRALKAFSQREGATLFMTLLAAFQLLLHRYTGQTDLVVGTSNGNRNHVETESLIGFFVNTLALRTDLSGDPSFRELLARVRHVALAAFDNQDVPFERLVEELQPDRDLGRSPIFQVMFILHNTPTERLQLRNLTLSGLECDIGTSKFDLTLNTTDLGQGIAAVMEYNTDLFDATTIRRMLSHWQLLVEQAMDAPDQPVSQLPMLSAAEQSRILDEWNDTASEFSANATLGDLFLRQVQVDPQAIAVELDGEGLTYEKLDQWSSALALRLAAAGVQSGSRVGVSVGRSPALVAALLAVLKSGAAFVPLDVDLPARRLEYVLEDSHVAVVLADKQSAHRLPTVAARLIKLDDLPGASLPRGELPAPHPLDAAYLMYTSGSTGQPKAVVVSHRSAVNFLESMRHQPGITATDTMLAVTPITFDISVLELLLPLIVGARVSIVDRVTAQDPQLLARKLDETRPNIMQATPATWRMLIDGGWSGDSQLKALCGGEALPPDLARQLLERCDSLWNMYGPTETTVWSAVQRILPEDSAVSIGRPIGNTQIYLLDSHLQPVPVGVPGELFIGGTGLANGYFRRPGLTAEKFIPNPFAKRPGERLYRTGDLARYLAGGRLEFLGRLDSQIKLRGLRIELGEIESVLRRDDSISNAVVLLRDDGRGPRLVAYVVASRDGAVSVDELRTRLGEQLPANMIPTEFVVMKSLPLTPAAKIDRRSLPAPSEDRPELKQQFTGPRNEMDRVVAELWQRLLPVSQIGIHDNFFDLGGHSLLLAQLQRMISATTQRDVSLVQLFQYPTIAAVSDFLSGKLPRDALRNGSLRAEARKQAFGEQ